MSGLRVMTTGPAKLKKNVNTVAEGAVEGCLG